MLGERAAVLRNSWRTRVIDALQVMVPLDRDRPGEAMATMADVLARGGSLILFPEGELGAGEGQLGPLHTGAARLSLASGAPIVPIGLTGTRELWLRRTITMRIGAPISPVAYMGDSAAGEGDEGARERARALTAELNARLRALLPGDGPRPPFTPLRRWLTNLL